MKITKKLRAEAAHILQVVASNFENNVANTHAAEREVGYGDYPYSLAGDLAREVLSQIPQRHHGQRAYAEAECMLLEGWEP